MKLLEKGQPINLAELSEALTRGSIDYFLFSVRRAFYRQFRDISDAGYLYVCEIFSDHLIVESSTMPESTFYHVGYSAGDDGIVFQEREEWEAVQLSYEPATLEARLRESNGDKLREEITKSRVTISEADADQPRYVTIDLAQADIVNNNRRRYSEGVVREAVRDANLHIKQSLGQGRAYLLGEDGHPGANKPASPTPRFLETIVVWEEITYDEKTKWARAKGRMIENSLGRDAIINMDAGVFPAASLRGYGDSQLVEEGESLVEEVLWLRLTGIDFVMDPGFSGAGVTKFENLNDEVTNTMSVKTGKDTGKDAAKKGEGSQPTPAELSVTSLREQHPDVVEQLLKTVELEERMAREAAEAEHQAKLAELDKLNAQRDADVRKALELDETADITTAVSEIAEEAKRLKAEENARKIAAFIEANTNIDHYPEAFRETLRKQVNDAKPQSVQEAKALIVAQREHLDGLLADVKLQTRGYGSVQYLGDTVEKELGIPAFAEAAITIVENLHRTGKAKKPNFEAMSQYEGGQFAMSYITKFDEMYGKHLKAEAQEFREAETTGDLSLPYSVIRAIVMSAFPDLVASNVFDFGIANSSAARIYYQSNYGEDTTVTPSVTDEAVTIVALDTWYDLANARIDFSSVVVQDDTDTTTYEFGTDFVIDFADGKIKALTGGSISASDVLHVDYTYMAVRKGENSVIERAKSNLSYVTLNIGADRLATQITNDAIVFAQSDLGWDAIMNTIQMLVREVRLNIDKNLITTALSQALSVGSNIAGTWTSATDSVTDLVQLMLDARTTVENRFYNTDYYLMSKTNGNKLVLWDGFTSAGMRPGFALNNAPGFLGDIGEVPVFTTTQMPDSWVLAGNRQLVQHRVFRPMRLDGPHQSIDASTGQLKSSKEWFVEEYSGHVSPLPEKASVIKVA